MPMRICEIWPSVGHFRPVFQLWQSFTLNLAMNHTIKQAHAWTCCFGGYYGLCDLKLTPNPGLAGLQSALIRCLTVASDWS